MLVAKVGFACIGWANHHDDCMEIELHRADISLPQTGKANSVSFIVMRKILWRMNEEDMRDVYIKPRAI